ncbi:MAG: polyhydroxyalkanoate synthesis repressor PhaR [Pseudomonadota bacterium]
MSEPRIIKKYPNRRLYDTEISSYITLGDVRELVLRHVPFQVIDARSKQDITRSILLQIIFEQEEDGEPIFSTQSLEQIVRFYGDDLQAMVSAYLEKSLRLFVEQQSALRNQMQSMLRGDPLTLMRDITDQNMNLWREMQESFLKPPRPRRRPPGPDDPAQR